MNLFYSLLILLFYLCQPVFAVDSLYENHTDISQAAKDFLLSSSKTLVGDVSVSLHSIDHRLNLKKCTSPLVIKPTGDTIKAGRNTLKVSCSSPSPWRIFITSTIEVRKKVFVIKHFVSKGQLLTKEDIRFKSINISKLNNHYLENETHIIGKEATRNLQAGNILTANNLTNPLLIKRGDTVNIVSQREGFKVTMKGQAMEDGSIGERINVKNLRTKKIINGSVTSKHSVKVLF